MDLIMLTKPMRYSISAILVGCLVAAMITTQSGARATDGAPPGRAVKVADGRFDKKTTWSIWLFGDTQRGSCWLTRVKSGDLFKNTTLCGFSVPKRRWQMAARASYGSSSRTKSMLFLLTRRSLDRILLRLQGRKRPVNFDVERLTAEEAKEAGLALDFGYSSTTFPGSIGCVQKITFIYRSGRREQGGNPNCK
jgi:hypothetical protein